MIRLALIAALALGGCNGGGDSPAGSLPVQGSLTPADLSPGQWSNYNGGVTFTSANGVIATGGAIQYTLTSLKMN